MKTKTIFAISVVLVLSVSCRFFDTDQISEPTVIEYHQTTMTTGNDGFVIYEDPITEESYSFRIMDIGSNQPVEGVEVFFKSDGKEAFVVAYHPQEKYLPVMTELNLITGAARLENYKNASPSHQGQDIVLSVIAVTELREFFWDWYDLVHDLPNLEKWGYDPQEYCVNPGQKAEILNTGADSIMLLAFTYESIVSVDLDEMLKHSLEMMLEYFDDEAVEGIIESNLEATKPAIVRWWVYDLTEDLPLTSIVPFGWCLEPLNQTSYQSVADWLLYGIEMKDSYAFEQIADPEGPYYANYIEGGQPNTFNQFMDDIEERINAQNSNPVCEGFSVTVSITEYDVFSSFWVWTEEWYPDWEINELCYAGCNEVDPPYTSSSAGFRIKEVGVIWVMDALFLADVDDEDLSFFMDTNQVIPCNRDVTTLEDLIPGNRYEPPPDYRCVGALETRLAVGDFAFVGFEPPLANRVRQDAGTNYSVVGNIQPGEAMEIIGGPSCANNRVWWEVRTVYGDLQGWTAEGDSTNYWLVPCLSAKNCPP